MVIIGGGVIGCSVAYHLAKLGWRDVLLLATGSSSPLTNADRRSALSEHARCFGVGQSSAVATRLMQTLWQLDHNANARLALEVLMLDLPRA